MSSLPECIGKLEGTDEVERSYAAEDLGYLNSPEAVRVLLEHLPREPSLIVRDAIAQALIRTDGDEAIQGTVWLFMSEDPQIRNLAVGVLKHKISRAIPFLMNVMTDGDADMRKFVLDVLCDFEGPGLEEIYAAGLADRDSNVVITAVENIGKVRLSGFDKRIEALLADTDQPMLLCACLETMGEIGSDSSLRVIHEKFPEQRPLPGYLKSSYLKAITALGGDDEFGLLAGSLLSQGADQRPPPEIN